MLAQWLTLGWANVACKHWVNVIPAVGQIGTTLVISCCANIGPTINSLTQPFTQPITLFQRWSNYAQYWPNNIPSSTLIFWTVSPRNASWWNFFSEINVSLFQGNTNKLLTDRLKIGHNSSKRWSWPTPVRPSYLPQPNLGNCYSNDPTLAQSRLADRDGVNGRQRWPNHSLLSGINYAITTAQCLSN